MAQPSSTQATASAPTPSAGFDSGPLPSSLRGKATLVIGGSSGIGFAVARLLGDVGARVSIASRHEDRLRSAARLLGRPEEVAAAVPFLMSNPYATGSVVAVDGGLTL